MKLNCFPSFAIIYYNLEKKHILQRDSMKIVYVVVDINGSVVGVFCNYETAERVRQEHEDVLARSGAYDTRVFIDHKNLVEE